MIGTKLAHYEITAHLGTGGMGEVYQATDTKLGRSVAVKFLPEAFSHDSERVARFEREARVLASLNHPNIAAIHGLEESGGRKFLVMELVAGETLAERIARGAIPLDESLAVAKEIAEALEVAHDKGVVHRDLKPANVKITPEGRVKVLDFGLAKMWESSSDDAAAAASNSPTRIDGTTPGVILGTAGYMSPEQARGRNVDRSADVWALACVTYEMLTGRPAFDGETITDILGAIVRADPDWNALPSTTPLHIRRLLQRCLQKDSRRRLRDAGAVRLEVQDILDDPSAAMTAKAARPGWVWIAAGSLLVAFAITTAILAWRGPSTPSMPASVMRFSLLPPSRGKFVPQDLPGTFSPDGRTLIFSAEDATGRHLLWLRALDSEETKPLPNTDFAYDVFWSLDSRQVAFGRFLDLDKIDIATGAIEKIADLPDGRGGSWNNGGVIIFTADARGPIFRVSASGGSSTPVTKLDASRQETGHWRPQFLPDGEHFLYLAVTAKPENSAIYAGSLNSPERKKIADLDVAALYAPPGYLLFTRNGNLMAWRFDATKLAISGEPTVVARDVVYSSTWAEFGFSISNNSSLAYHASAHPTQRLFWFDRTGKQAGSVGELFDSSGTPKISPDGRRALLPSSEPGNRAESVWILDLARGVTTRFTQDVAADETSPVWSPNGDRIAFETRRGLPTLHIRPAFGGEDEWQLNLPSTFSNTGVEDWSPDGKTLLLSIYDTKTKLDLWTVSVTGDHTPKLFHLTNSNRVFRPMVVG